MTSMVSRVEAFDRLGAHVAQRALLKLLVHAVAELRPELGGGAELGLVGLAGLMHLAAGVAEELRYCAEQAVTVVIPVSVSVVAVVS